MPQIVDRAVAFATPWFEVIAKTLENEESPYYSLKLKDYVSIIAKTEDGKILLVKQFRPAVERYTLELPAGLVEEGEIPEKTAIRELSEETGYKADSIELLGKLVPDTGRLCNRMWCYFCDNVKPEPATFCKDPDIELITCSVDELNELIVNGEFDHALHLALIALAFVKNKF